MKRDILGSQVENLSTSSSTGSAAKLKKSLLIALTALGISSFAGTEKAPSFSQDKDIAQSSRMREPKKEALSESTFVVEASNDTINKDSLNTIIDRKALEIKKQLEQEFLKKKFKEFSAILAKDLIAFKDDVLFSKGKTEELSDKKIDMLIEKIPSAKDLMWLAAICKEAVKFADDLLNGKEVALDDKSKIVIKTGKQLDADLIVKLDDRRSIFSELNTTIEKTKLSPNLFEKISDNAEVAKHVKALDSLKVSLSTEQSNLIALQKELEKQSNTFNDSIDKKIQFEGDLKTLDISHVEFNTTVTSDSASLAKKHAIEKKMQEVTTNITKIETSIKNIAATIATLEGTTTPNKKKDIDAIYANYATALNSYLAAVKSQYTEIMLEKNKDIVAGIQLLQQEELATTKSIDSLLQAHKLLLATINQEKNKSVLDSASNVLPKYQQEETKLSKSIETENEKLININVVLGIKFQQSYDIYMQRLNKELSKQTFYRNMFTNQIPGLQKEIDDMNITIKKNIEDVKKLSLSQSIKDVNLCQRKVKENQTLVKNIVSIKKDIENKQKMADNIQNKIDKINKAIESMENKKHIAKIATEEIYLSSKMIETETLKLTNAKETKGIYDSLLAARKIELAEKVKLLSATDTSISQLSVIESNDYTTISNLLAEKDTTKRRIVLLEKDIAYLNEKIAGKNIEIHILNLTISGWNDIYAENLEKVKGLQYGDSSKDNEYLSKDIQPVELLLPTPVVPKKTTPKSK